MSSLRRHEGYVRIDNGFGPDMQPLGVVEMVCFTCPHCNYLTVGKKRSDRGYCQKCDDWLCNKPGCNSECNPIIRDVAIAQRNQDAGLSFLGRDKGGHILYPPSYQDKERIF